MLMRIVGGTISKSVFSVWYGRESVGGPNVLTLEIDDNAYEWYCTHDALKRLIDELQDAYDEYESRVQK